MTLDWQQQRATGTRFGFGENWTRYSRLLNTERIDAARASLVEMLGRNSLNGLALLDIGCGSGLFSLCARQLGAEVVSFDYDPQSVSCTQGLREKYSPNDPKWKIMHGSILDHNLVTSLGHYDIVYSWGVLHHTGKMWDALNNAAHAVKSGGTLYISIYNDQGFISAYWLQVKRAYNSFPLFKPLIVMLHAPYLFLARMLYRAAIGKGIERGMSIWHDMLDWVGGYPFEVARPDQIFGFYRDRGFELLELKTCGGKQGCNEFVFRKKP